MQQRAFWMHKEQPEYPMLRGRHSADAAVVGGGLTGLTTALWLGRSGLKVTLLEAARLGGGASACCAGVVSLTGGPSYAQLERRRGVAVSDAYAQTQLAAFRAVRSLAQEQGPSSSWKDTDAQLIADGPKAWRDLEQEAEAMKRAGLAASVAQPSLCPLPAGASLTLRDMAVMQPARYLRYLAAQAVRQGVRIFEGSRATAMETHLVHTERGSVQAPYIVIATGYPIVNTPGWYFLKMRQRQSWLMPVQGTVKFEGLFLAADGSFALRRLREGALLQLNASAGDGGAQAARAWFGENCAAALGCGAPEDLYGGMECFTGDGLPFIGPYGRKTPNLFVAAGYGGRGIVGSMLAAQAISARVLGLPAEGYDIYSGQRMNVGPGAVLNMAGRYAGGLALRPHAPRCPHMGCRLVYNAQSRLWECPCHGSRFDDIGRVLNAPAVHDAQVRRRR